MSLPAGQERTLHDIEGALQASEPQLASMFAIFARLNRDEPVGAEPVQRVRSRWLPSRSALSAVVLIPVMFAAVIIGALFSGGARATASSASASSASAGSASASGARAAAAHAQAPFSARQGPCPPVDLAAFTGGQQGFPPPARAGTSTARPSGMC